jgi:hypothetical protein
MQTASISADEHVLRALQSNKDHQAAVKTQIEQLENKLAALDKLLVCAVSKIPLGKLTGHPRLPQRNTTKTTSNMKWEDISLFPGLQRSRLQSLPKNSSRR